MKNSKLLFCVFIFSVFLFNCTEKSDINSNTKMIYVKGGRFEMGQPDPSISELSTSDEQPVHEVFVNSFYMSKTEETQAEYKSIIGENPSYFKGDSLPVEYVDWYEAVEYCNKKSEIENLQPCYKIDKTKGEKYENIIVAKRNWVVRCDFKADGYRLPTEAEWEYAANSGKKFSRYKYSGSDNIDETAWYLKNSDYKTHNVRMKKPNQLGLYDMSGNVSEWCWDWYDDFYYANSSLTNPKGHIWGRPWVVRGGSYNDYSANCRVKNRFFNPFYINYHNSPISSSTYGFRIVRRGNIYFQQNTYNFYTLTDQTYIGKIQAKADNENHEIIYSLTGENSKYFKIDKNTGEISLSSFRKIDFDKFTMYKLAAKAEVSGTKDIAYTELHIKNLAPPEIVYAEGGVFEMGSSDKKADYNEKPVHTVMLNSFYIGKYEITQGQYECFHYKYVQRFGNTDYPVGQNYFSLIAEYCNNLSTYHGLELCYKKNRDSEYECDFSANGYRLPTEAEWEYAAKGGQKSKGYKYSGSNDCDEAAWYKNNSGGRVHKVGTKKPNELGIYDMSGNAWERCSIKEYSDNYFSKDKPISNPKGLPDDYYYTDFERGGSWKENSYSCRNTNRPYSSGIRTEISSTLQLLNQCYGFRLVKRGPIYFKEHIYNFLIDENDNVIGIFNAETDEKNSIIKYSLLGEYSKFFKIDENTGEISLSEEQKLNFNKSYAFNLIIKAEIPETMHKAFANLKIRRVYKPEMILVQGGEFEMESNDEETENDEMTVHKVKVNDFYIGKYEITQAEFESVMNENPSKFNYSDHPVDGVYLHSAAEFCNRLSEVEGLEPCYIITEYVEKIEGSISPGRIKKRVKCDFSANGYRLPTEAEWEYAARGGKKSKGYKYSGSNDLNEVGWYWRNSGENFLSAKWYYKKLDKNLCRTHKVGQKKPNELGIYDMSGNVWEWCLNKNDEKNTKDSEKDSNSAERGGSWRSEHDQCMTNYSRTGYSGMGLRLVRNYTE